MKVAIISDLHIGAEARSKDFRPTDYDDNTCIDKTYKLDFTKYVKSKGITADYLIITGDITNSAALSEFELATSIIPELAESMHICPSKIIYIPGNHDIDWNITKNVNGREKELRKQLRYSTFLNGLAHDNGNLKELVTDPYFTIWNFEDILIVGLNSAFHDASDSLIHNGNVTDNTIELIDNKLKQLQQESKQKIKLFITHHHPFQYSTGSDDFDISIMHNSEELLKMLARNEIDMVIHGHKHIPNLITHIINGLHPLPILCAGSFSVLLDQKLNGSVLNTFHIINFETKLETSEPIRGFIENYSYAYPRKWDKCKKDNSRLLFKQGFGEYGNINYWEKKLSPVIKEKIDISNIIEWDSLHTDFPELQYCHPDAIKQLSDTIANKLHLTNFESTNGRVLFKNHAL